MDDDVANVCFDNTKDQTSSGPKRVHRIDRLAGGNVADQGESPGLESVGCGNPEDDIMVRAAIIDDFLDLLRARPIDDLCAKLAPGGLFVADEILAKHDETYKTPEPARHDGTNEHKSESLR